MSLVCQTKIIDCQSSSSRTKHANIISVYFIKVRSRTPERVKVLFRSILQCSPLHIAADVAANVEHYSGRKILVDEQDLLENVWQHHNTMYIDVADRYAPRSARAWWEQVDQSTIIALSQTRPTRPTPVRRISR